ncbi:hypothetical protein O8C52_26575 [Agrobacterium rhizogenes]|nr:hypothetical protein [Rhizobium rhizogenes]
MQLRHQAVEGAANTAAIAVALADLDGDIDQPSDQLFGLDRFLLGTHRQTNVEELRYALLDGQALWQKLILAQRRLDLEHTTRLNEVRG